MNVTLNHLVVMGVAGCGKSTLAHAIAEHYGWAMIEGDDFHSAHSIEKMRAGMPLTDEDRRVWLTTLAGMLAQAERPTVLACSALRRAYRDILRGAQNGGARTRVGFVYIALSEADSYARVARRPAHSFPASLVHSQFETLEPPDGESGVLRVTGADTTQDQLLAVAHWLDFRDSPSDSRR